ncbi:ankyrin repeat protein [Lysobacter enzymogenes]|uniref:ankyrin repeat domain-containing protein n=1 Tax=Lysobacter enzymogenes TaxID=69 RepID=UPI0033909B94
MTQKIFAASGSAQLAEAVREGDTQLLRELIAAGGNPNAQGEHGVTLLQWAIRSGSRSGFDALLAAGADYRRHDESGNTALHTAAESSSDYFLEHLLKAGADVNTPNAVNHAPPLFSALKARRKDNIVRLLRAGADLRAADRQGGTPLLIAAQINDTASVLAFLKAGADPHARDRAGATFQRYLYMSDERLLKGEAKRDLDAIQDWLREHNIAIEDGVQT